MKNFINNIFDAISNNLISGGAYYLIAKAAVVTVLIVVLAWIIAGIAGIGISYIMTYEKKGISRIGRAISFVFRSVPVLLSVWLFHYCIFGSSTMSGIITMGLSIGLFGAGHLSEIISESVKKTGKTFRRNEGKAGKVLFPHGGSSGIRGFDAACKKTCCTAPSMDDGSGIHFSK